MTSPPSLAAHSDLVDHVDPSQYHKPTLQCPQCTDVFHFERFLNLHLRHVHHRRPAHHCPHCRSAFGSLADVNRHLLSAHPDRPRLTPSPCRVQSTAARGPAIPVDRSYRGAERRTLGYLSVSKQLHDEQVMRNHEKPPPSEEEEEEIDISNTGSTATLSGSSSAEGSVHHVDEACRRAVHLHLTSAEQQAQQHRHQEHVVHCSIPPLYFEGH